MIKLKHRNIFYDALIIGVIMRYSYMSFKLITEFFNKTLTIETYSNQADGFYFIVLLDRKTLFELVSDYRAKFPMPFRYPHNWGFVRWGIGGKICHK